MEIVRKAGASHAGVGSGDTCHNCGGAMYSEQKAAAYVCTFCGTEVSWTDAPVFWGSPIAFRHKPVQIVDGAMKLGAVEVMWEVDAHDKGCLSQHYRQKSVEEKLALCSFCPSTFWIDAQKTGKVRGRCASQ
ncbi:hypothetical protein [uncultured Selenomonas sp.]|uniref:hypothetical protein n=1 Tax=uncultured Selenomonas sp. TaxID=159275 RepID=UPI0025E84B1A|nr:hypothetical protein [uncultured Selenomonas sp.]